MGTREALKDPELPPGAIVETYEDGGALRNDGVKLTPASQNPWYVLATVAVPESGDIKNISQAIYEGNPRYWNGWMCQEMDGAERKELAEKMGLTAADLAPLDAEEIKVVKARFKKAFPEAAPESTIPNPDDQIDFSLTNFSVQAIFRNFCFTRPALFRAASFEKSADFQSTYFFKNADFQKACFAKGVYFKKTRFTGFADFQGTLFSDHAVFKETQFLDFAVFEEAHFNVSVNFENANFVKGGFFREARFNNDAFFREATFTEPATFQETHFARSANFEKADFNGYAYFHNAHFTGDADFQMATFEEGANFSDGSFKAKTVFDGAMFKGEVPQFFHREMHQNTGFTESRSLWPEVTAENAEQGRKAYTRLRQVAAEIYDPDLEHFFLRQEMRCKEALAGRFEKGLFVLYRKFADSGISVKRPAAVLAGLWALGAAMFWGYFLAPMGHHVPESVAASPGWSGIGLSFANVFAFLGLSRAYFADVLTALPIGLKYFAGMQTVFGAVFFFLLALGLRNRFRLK